MLLAFIVLYLCLTVAIGFYAARRVKTSGEYVLAGRSLPMVFSASAMFATWFGAETVLGASSEFISHGLLGVVEDPFGAALCLFLIGMFFVRPLYKLNILTFCDFYKIKFGRTAEVISGLCMVPSYLGWVAAQFVALGIILNVITGLPVSVGIVLGALIVLLYTYIGGMWAISVTDFFQTIIIVVGLLLLAWGLGNMAGGFSQVISRVPDGFFKFYPEATPLGISQYIAAWITVGLGSIPQQDVFQRVMSAKNEQTARHSAYLGGAMYLSIALIPLFVTLAASQAYPDIDKGADGQMLLPNVVLAHGSLPIQVLFFGALLSAIMSTASGGVLAPASVVAENFIRPLFPDKDDKYLLRWLRGSVLGIGVVAVIMASIQSNIYELVSQSSALGLVSIFVPMAAGLYKKSATTTGAISAMVVGMAVWLPCEIVDTEIPAVLFGLGASFIAQFVGDAWGNASKKQ